MIVAKPRVAVIYNEPILPHDHPDAVSEGDVVSVARSVASALGGNGFTPVLLAAGPPLSEFLQQLTDCDADLIFNLIEGFGGETAAEPFIASVFEILQIPYTGSPAGSLSLCRSKARTKAILRGNGLPTAWSVVVDPDEPIPSFEWPGHVLVKPEGEDASLGIDQGSVVTDPLLLPRAVERVRRAYGGSVLIEAYLPGPEYNVGVLAVPSPRALPVAEVVFAERAGAWPILTYAAKWDGGSAEDLASPIACPARVGPEMAARLETLAVAAFRATGCRDYARIDFRLDERGEPMILEVNPNPDLGPNSGWARAAGVAGLAYDSAVSAIARQASGRSGRSGGAGSQGRTSNQTSDRSSTTPL